MGYHLDAVVAVLLTLGLVWLHTHGRRLPLVSDLLDFVVGKPSAVQSSTPVIDGLQSLLDELKKRLPHPDDTKPATQVFELVTGPDGKAVLQPK